MPPRFNKLTLTTSDGRKKLTAAGVASIILTIVGLVTNVVSEDLQRREAPSSQAEQVASEAKRTNDIIIAGRPLRSLTLTWAFRGLGDDLERRLKKGEDAARTFIEDHAQACFD